MPDAPLALPGTPMRMTFRVRPSFWPDSHPAANYSLGPLVRGWQTFTYVGPDATRDRIHIAALPYNEVMDSYRIVYFGPHEALFDLDDPRAGTGKQHLAG
jgi:hypothetical protein